ncbi:MULTISPECIES: DUF3293 domain-containing protein [unclassified Thioalkalivibrio]|uniref:DUF3293 domain-containing protein n=1 Tax=unclassified Thioalkalivibrio TaxID=2621013 RepID=UPI00039CA369|nr:MULTISPECIES: DUF3293 domain-containing protein [unclassified Thioalkalivibrio]
MAPNSRGSLVPPNPPGSRAALARAYASTHYQITLPGQTLVLHIGQREPRLEAFLQTQGVDRASLLTAWNPRSHPLPERENRKHHARLARELEHGGWSCWPTVHRDPNGHWPDEPGYCVLGMGTSELDAWLVGFDQNAAVVIEPPSVPHLVWHPALRTTD